MFSPQPNQARSVGETLRAMREGAGLSIREVAERTSTTKATVSLFERGQRVISADLLARIARVIADEIASKRGGAA